MKIKKPICLKEVEVGANKFVQINLDILRFPNGKEASHVKVIHKNQGGVVLLVMNQEKKIYLHHAYHYAADKIFLEFIRGFVDENEKKSEAAIRELSEEFIFQFNLDTKPKFLGEIHADSTIINASASAYLIKVNTSNKKKKRIDCNEALGEGKFFSNHEIEKLIQNGDITDGYTLSVYSIANILGIF
jgi:hypothetical protein